MERTAYTFFQFHKLNFIPVSVFVETFSALIAKDLHTGYMKCDWLRLDLLLTVC
jgi:hypothetical protein